MARRYTNRDHYCEKCGKRIGDGEDYYECSRGFDFCIPCSDDMCSECDKCSPTKGESDGED